MFEQYYLPVTEAALITGFPVKKWIQWILKSLIPSDPELSEDSIKGINRQILARQTLIPVTALPEYYREEYLKIHLIGDSLFRIDFIGFLEHYGEQKYFALLNEINVIKEFITIRQYADSASKSKAAEEFALQSGYSIATLYRKENLFMQSDLRKLISAPDNIYHPRDMCRLSEDFARFEWDKPNHLKKCEILDKLRNEAKVLGTAVCNKCPYNKHTRNNIVFSKKYSEFDFSCKKVGCGMLSPASKDPFNRFLSSISEQEITFSRRGPNAWEDLFMHVTKRDRPERCNSVWFGDHHLADNVVICGYDDKGKPILKRPWLTCNYDSASTSLIGSVVSVRPNSMTIAEAFCRSAAFTVDSPFSHLCEHYYVDRGMDYRARILEGRDYDLQQRLEQDYHLNRAFCDNPLLPALNVSVHHALPRTGRSKTIERMFRTLTEKYFREIPGWVGNCPDNRPFDFEKEEKRLIESGQLWTLEKFARYWFDVIVPGYNNFIPEDEKESPLQKYMRMEKADTIVPDWDTLTVFMKQKTRHKVHTQGIKYNNDLFWHPSLAEEGVMGNYVYIYDFDQSFCHSISVIHNRKYLCEAYPLVHQQVIEEDRLKLEHHLEEQKAQKRRISRKVTAVKQTLKKSMVNARRYVEYEPENDLAEDETSPQETAYDKEPTMYCETIDCDRDRKEAVVLSEDANEIAKVARSTIETMEQILNGPKNTSFEDYFISRGESVLGKEKSNGNL